MQQYLPFTVLKHVASLEFYSFWHLVATVLTVYGIETVAQVNDELKALRLQQYLPFTVLKPPRKGLSYHR